MLEFIRDLPEARNHPDLVKFLDVCKTTCGEQTVQFSDFENAPFLRFWDSSLILRWDSERKDFRYIFWGTKLATIYGMELTGRYIIDGDHKQNEDPFIKTHFESMSEQKIVHLGGSLGWRDKRYQKWNQVIQPLSRNGNINETLTYVTFR